MSDIFTNAADTIGLSPTTTMIIAGVIAVFVALIIVNQVVASMSDTKRAPAQAKIGGQVEMTRRKIRDRFLVAGPAFAGKTQLYFKLMGTPVNDTVSSSELNETTQGPVSVKVPARLTG